MSVITERFIICNGTQNEEKGCYLNYGVDIKIGATINYLRKGAHEEGWKTINEKDYCPNCLEFYDKALLRKIKRDSKKLDKMFNKNI